MVLAYSQQKADGGLLNFSRLQIKHVVAACSQQSELAVLKPAAGPVEGCLPLPCLSTACLL